MSPSLTKRKAEGKGLTIDEKRILAYMLRLNETASRKSAKKA
jgi:hypothetical protein